MKKNKLNLYLVSQDENSDYDTYDSFVIACEDEDVARNTNPCTMHEAQKDWGRHSEYTSWCSSPDHVTVTYLGIADASVKHGIVCSSFNAG